MINCQREVLGSFLSYLTCIVPSFGVMLDFTLLGILMLILVLLHCIAYRISRSIDN